MRTLPSPPTARPPPRARSDRGCRARRSPPARSPHPSFAPTSGPRRLRSPASVAQERRRGRKKNKKTKKKRAKKRKRTNKKKKRKKINKNKKTKNQKTLRCPGYLYFLRTPYQLVSRTLTPIRRPLRISRNSYLGPLLPCFRLIPLYSPRQSASHPSSLLLAVFFGRLQRDQPHGRAQSRVRVHRDHTYLHSLQVFRVRPRCTSARPHACTSARAPNPDLGARPRMEA